MDDLLKEAGLEYAKALPGAIAAIVGLLVLGAWLAYRAHEQGSDGFVVILGVVAVVLIAQLPAAIANARSYCRSQRIGPPSFGAVAYSDPKCRTAFPNGP